MSAITDLVTGVSRSIAKHCAVDLLNHGYRSRGTVRSRAKSRAVRDTIAKHVAPALLVDKQARASIPDLGRSMAMDNARTRQALGIHFRSMSESVPAMAESLFALGLV
jgi:nucleoside-diphosphate-sugar epimerase